MASSDMGQAISLAHTTYNARMQEHAHSGRAILETIAHVAKTHPAVFGLGILFLLEAIAAERHHLQAAGSGTVPTPATPGGGLHLPNLPHLEAPHLAVPDLHIPTLRVDHIRPGKVALEVFGALILLKFATFGARMFRRKSQSDVWFAPASRIHLFSGSLGAYYLAKSIRSPRISAWRNAAAALFVTDALKPVLKAPKRRKGAPAPAARSAPLAMAPQVETPVATGPTPTPPAPVPPASGPGGPAGGAPAPAPSGDTTPGNPTTAGAANDPATAAVGISPGQVHAAAPQFWTPPPRPDRNTIAPLSPVSGGIAGPGLQGDGSEHGLALASGTAPAPQMAARPAEAASGVPTGEILQWTGFSGASDTAARLAD